MVPEGIVAFFYDESYDLTRAFYDAIRRKVDRDSVVLNLGAGPPVKTQLRNLKDDVGRLVGADIDPIVLDNDQLDEARLIEDDRLPFSDEEFDVIFSDYVFEHVERPEPLLREAWRVLRPGGHMLFRTPNIRHYVPLIASLTPHWFHLLVANRARGMNPDAHEPWKTFYRMNDPTQLEALARRVGYRDVEIQLLESFPSYLRFNTAAFVCGVAYERLVSNIDALSRFRGTMLGRFQK